MTIVFLPTNIAVIKYWGKREPFSDNIPLNSSISVTLDYPFGTTTTIESLNNDENDSSLMIEIDGIDFGQDKKLQRAIEKCTKNKNLTIKSHNHLPMACGLATSASGYAALIYGLYKHYDLIDENGEMSRKCREMSGSSCRSLLGGWIESTPSQPIHQLYDHEWWKELQIMICIVEKGEKIISSTQGMIKTQQESSLFPYRQQLLPTRIREMKEAIEKRDFTSFGNLCMKEALEMHACCINAGISYLNDQSWKIIRRIQEINKRKDDSSDNIKSHDRIKAAFTFDAGPNPIIFYLKDDKENIKKELEKEMTNENKFEIIFTTIGQGPRIIN